MLSRPKINISVVKEKKKEKHTRGSRRVASQACAAGTLLLLLVTMHVRIRELYDTARLRATRARDQTARVRSKQLVY